ncbi:hypothetical protein [Mycobacterium syngnathidarum]
MVDDNTRQVATNLAIEAKALDEHASDRTEFVVGIEECGPASKVTPLPRMH